MARYIDADKMVSKDNAYTTFPHDLAGCDDNDLVRWINEQPTADVVPKSEVAREIASNILKLSEECGGGVLFYRKMRQYAEELKKCGGKVDENNT